MPSEDNFIKQFWQRCAKETHLDNGGPGNFIPCDILISQPQPFLPSCHPSRCHSVVASLRKQSRQKSERSKHYDRSHRSFNTNILKRQILFPSESRTTDLATHEPCYCSTLAAPPCSFLTARECFKTLTQAGGSASSRLQLTLILNGRKKGQSACLASFC